MIPDAARSFLFTLSFTDHTLLSFRQTDLLFVGDRGGRVRDDEFASVQTGNGGVGVVGRDHFNVGAHGGIALTERSFLGGDGENELAVVVLADRGIRENAVVGLVAVADGEAEVLTFVNITVHGDNNDAVLALALRIGADLGNGRGYFGVPPGIADGAFRANLDLSRFFRRHGDLTYVPLVGDLDPRDGLAARHGVTGNDIDGDDASGNGRVDIGGFGGVLIFFDFRFEFGELFELVGTLEFGGFPGLSFGCLCDLKLCFKILDGGFSRFDLLQDFVGIGRSFDFVFFFTLCFEFLVLLNV